MQIGSKKSQVKVSFRFRAACCHCEERLVGQASSLSIRDDRQDAGPTRNLSFGHP